MKTIEAVTSCHLIVRANWSVCFSNLTERKASWAQNTGSDGVNPILPEWVPCLMHSSKSCFYTGIGTGLALFNAFVFVFVFGREQGREGGREAGRAGLINACSGKTVLLRLPPAFDPVSMYPREPFQLGSKVLKTAPTLEGQFPVSLKTSLSSGRALGCHRGLTIRGLRQTSCCYAEPCTSSRRYPFYKHLI